MKNKGKNSLPEENPDKSPTSVNRDKLSKAARLSLTLIAVRDQGEVLRAHSWASHHPHMGLKAPSVVPASSPCSGPHEETEFRRSANASKAEDGLAPTALSSLS